MKINAQTKYCPNGCSFTQQMTKVNLSETHAEKRCLICRRKFTYIRSDTPEGKRLRSKKWYQDNTKAAQESTEKGEVKLTPAQRMAKKRQEKKRGDTQRSESTQQNGVGETVDSPS